MQFLAGLKAHRLAGAYGNLSAGPRITANPGLARPHIEDSKTTQLDPVSGRQGLFQAFKDGIYRRFRLVALQAGLFNYMMDDVLFDQRSTPND